ncbi:LPXTG cell wall anchor domain-containing protein [Staphylococcus saccharolyticus]|uniref:LPXTG cell wall anchor domain-containing protein n=1 Tax=Staphylococcus saccharolyticus TaxID=33028 RepID=UPI003B75C625
MEKLDLKAYKKATARKEVKRVAKIIVENIDTNQNATTQAKRRAQTLVEEIVNLALNNINLANLNAQVDEIVKQAIDQLNAIKVEEEIIKPSKDSIQCPEQVVQDSHNNITKETKKDTVNVLPDTGQTDENSPLAGAALISGLALIAARKSKKDKQSND